MPLSHCRTFAHVSHLTGNIEAPFNSTRVAETRQKRGRNAAETRQSNHRPCLARLLYRWRASLACSIAAAPYGRLIVAAMAAALLRTRGAALLRLSRSTAPLRASTRAPLRASLASAAAGAPRPLPSSQGDPLGDRAFAWFRRYLAIRAAVYGVGGLAVLGGALYGWSVWSEAAVRRSMLRTFEDGGRPGWERGFDDSNADVARPELVAELAALLRPEVAREYVVVVGETGTGKSTAVRQAVRQLPWPKGVVYFDAPELLPKFGMRLAKTVGFSTETLDPWGAARRWLSGLSKTESDPKLKEEPLATWLVVQDALEEVAAQYLTKHGRPVTLVIDAADLIAKHDDKFFLRLQDFAKKCADNKSMTVAFVSSEGTVLPLLTESSAFSRAHAPFEVGDIPDADAVEYLTKRGVPRERAQVAVRTITGGRLWLLNYYVGAHLTKSDEAILREFQIDTRTIVNRQHLPTDHVLFRQLLDGPVHKDTAVTLVGKPVLDALVKANVLAVHPDRSHTFHSRHVVTFFTEEVAAADRRAEEVAAADRRAAEVAAAWWPPRWRLWS